MKKKYFLIASALLCSLFIYLFFRTEKTVVNEILIATISFEYYEELRDYISNILPLNEYIIYSLPEGLWVFVITLTSKFLFLKVGKQEISLVYLPLIFSIGLELLQLIGFTNGHFDIWDIGFSIAFWAIAAYLIRVENTNQNIIAPINSNSVICAISYSVVYLAHVWK